MKIYDISRLPNMILLGFDGENNWRPQAFDCTPLLENHPNGTITLWILPDGETQAFPVALTRDGNTVVWTPLSEEMTARTGALQIVCTDGTDVGKSRVALFRVDSSILPGAEHPSQTPSWAVKVVEDVNAAIDGIGETVEELLPDAVADYMTEHPFTETDPTVPSWAKQTQKPTYTAQEVGALPASYTPPVASVNGKTGAVQLDASDVGALPEDTVIPEAVTEQTVSGWGFTKNTGTYSKPSGGIPKTDLAADVQTSLDKTDTFVTPQQFGAKGDGVHDDTEAINNCFKYGASNVFFPDGTYLVDAHHDGFKDETDGGLRPRSNSVITLSPDATIKCSTSPTDFYNILHFVNVENVIVQGGKIVGDKATHVQISEPTYEFGHGVAIQNSTNIVVRDMEICDCIGDGVILNVSGNADITLDNLTIHDCRRQGISLISGDGIVITNCEIYGINGANPQAGIDIEPDGKDEEERSVANVVINNCNIHDTVGASIIVANVTNVIDQIHINGCLLDYMFFNGGSNVTMSGSKAKRVCVGCDDSAVISASSIEEIWLKGGSAVFTGCNFISSGIEKFINVLSDVVSGKAVESVAFNGCSFDVSECTHFMYIPPNGVGKVKLLEFKDCSAKITHDVTSTYAASGLLNYMPIKTVISGSRFDLAAKIYQLFTAKPGSTFALRIIDSEIVNSNSYRTNYFFSGDAAYDVWIENSTISNYGNMLSGGGDTTTGEIVLVNDRFVDFLHPDGKSSAGNVTITNITRDNTKYLSGATSNIQAQIDAKSDFSGSYNDLTDKPTIPDISGKADASDVSALESRLNALADSDDTTLDQLSEIVAYIKNNKTLIDNITTGKVSVSDIVDNLTSSATNKPLSANQGRALKALIDAIVVPTESTVSGWGFTKNTGTYSKPSGGIPDSDIASAATWNAKGTYSKPSGGIPKSDLASAVQTSLGKADTALQQHQSLAGYATQTWVEGKGYLTLADLPIYNGGVS